MSRLQLIQDTSGFNQMNHYGSKHIEMFRSEYDLFARSAHNAGIKYDEQSEMVNKLIEKVKTFI